MMNVGSRITEDDAIRIAVDEGVNIIHTNERGKWEYAVTIMDNEYWLDLFPTIERAREYCNEHGYRYQIMCAYLEEE